MTRTAEKTMSAVKFEVELPSELVLALNVKRSELGHRGREWIVLELFQEGVISAGKAAEILGQQKTGFLELLNARGLSYLDSTPEELDSDLEVALGAARSSDAS